MAADIEEKQALASEKETEIRLEGGTYEIIRNRLQTQGEELRQRLARLNEARREIFGAIEATLTATERISTDNNCIPRDMAPLGGRRFLFGYNVHIGLKSQLQLSDVFAVVDYDNESHAFSMADLSILQSGRFEDDFKDLYRYYKETVFAKFSIIGPHLFMVFRIGKSVKDIKTFKWALGDEGQLTYIDNRSDHEFRFPSQHEFEWTRTTRDMHVSGVHPHISIVDRLFVEAVGGDITFKVENNTDSGRGIYAEGVENKDQTLDDAEIHYAVLEHIILVRIRPYRENDFRYFIFNGKVEEVHRVDEIADSCVLLPENQGLIFSNGYYLQSGELKRFESNVADMRFERRLASGNGEDYLYLFYNQESGDYILLSYNVIEQTVASPILCNGYACFPNGVLLYFRAEEEPTKHHVVQIWQTPYVSGEFAFSEKNDAFLYKIGNPAIVRCMAECNELLKLLYREEVYADLYVDLVKKATDIGDAYFWLDKPEAFQLKETILAIKAAAGQAIDEFEKVRRLKGHAEAELERVGQRTGEILKQVFVSPLSGIDHFVGLLAELRAVRGEIVTLKEIRYMDVARVEELDDRVRAVTGELSDKCVTFLLSPEALNPYDEKVSAIDREVAGIKKAADGRALQQRVTDTAGELEMLIEIVSNLKIEDATHTTRIIDSISTIYGRLNTTTAALKNRIKSLAGEEGVADFNAQLKLLNQSVVNYLDLCDTPEKCDEYLTKVMIQIEELEGRFADFDAFVGQLTEKRDELYSAFEARKITLMEQRNRRADTLLRSAERILKGIGTRVGAMKEINAINGYFASDLMIEKIRDIVTQLVDLGDTVKADDIQARLKTIREETVRQLKDRKELYADGENVILFGNHRFSVNRQPLDLTIVRREEEQYFHLTGTNFFERIDDPAFLETRAVWAMTLPSEDHAIYRGEYLAHRLLASFDAASEDERIRIRELSEADLVAHVQRFMGPRYAEGYTKGVHDRDTARIFGALRKIRDAIGLLRFHPRVRTLGRLFWYLYDNADHRALISAKLEGFGRKNRLFPGAARQEKYIGELQVLIADFAATSGLFEPDDAPAAALYLFCQLIDGEGMVVSREATELLTGFEGHLRANRALEDFRGARKKLETTAAAEFDLLRDWIGGYVTGLDHGELTDYVDEAALLLFTRKSEGLLANAPVDQPVIRELTGMVGDHQVIQDGVYHLNYHHFMDRLEIYERKTLPAFYNYQELKKNLTDRMREELRLEEFKPRILTSFVRNKLINRVYLPLVGDNLAKQIGVVGEEKRTDLMGMLLLISPPGYGKTTLMEYLANRLGIIFMKINGPAIGHQVTSLDPAEAPFASAREELLKLNLSLEMGDNVMLYLDDIQHCNPEFLQKFISLCDAQRKIEGVYKGRSRTYDLRGRKVVVVMAGNPYTESGEKFKIPDMLANRADTYNLGDIIGDSAEAFKLSYLENALTSNAVLNKLASKSRQDVYSLIRIAETGDREGVEFEGAYTREELDEMTAVMAKLITVRDVILTVNQAYIHSAGQADAYRTEPPFLLQGSYRNMNRLAEKIVPIMNAGELQTLLLSHYENEAQTLTTGAEANLLKFLELTGWLDQEASRRWEEIKATFRKQQLFYGADAADPVNRVVAQLGAFQDGLMSIREVLASALDREAAGGETLTRLSLTDETLERIEALAEAVRKSAQNAASPEVLPPTLQSEAGHLSKVLLHLLHRQFRLMNTWMSPLFKESLRHSDELKKLFKEMQEMQSRFKGVLREKGDFDEGLAYYNTAIKINPKDAEAYYNRGMTWYNKQDLPRALSDIQNAVCLKPKNKRYQRFAAFLQAEIVRKAPDPEK